MEKYIATGNDEADYISPKEWGRDHYSTLLFVKHCIENEDGKIDNERMRCNPRIHRQLLGKAQFDFGIPVEEYPTRLKDGKIKEKHDDFSCLEDMVRFGIIEAKENHINDNPFCNCVIIVSFTEKGAKYSHALEVLKKRGLNFAMIDHEKITNALINYNV